MPVLVAFLATGTRTGLLAYVWVRRGRMLHVIDLGSRRTLRADHTPPGRLPFLFSGARSQR